MYKMIKTVQGFTIYHKSPTDMFFPRMSGKDLIKVSCVVDSPVHSTRVTPRRPTRDFGTQVRVTRKGTGHDRRSKNK